MFKMSSPVRQLAVRGARHALAFPAIAMLLLVQSCGGSGLTDAARIASISLRPDAVTVAVGALAPLTAELRDEKGAAVNGARLVWTSSDTSVARVSAAGVVTARQVGSAMIAASVQGMSATTAVTVSPRSVSSVRLSPSSAAIRVGETTVFEAQALDAAGDPLEGRLVAWASSNVSVASVDSDGRVTGKLPGAVTITATSEGRTGSAAVTVSVLPVASVTVSPDEATLSVGENRALNATPRDDEGGVLNGRSITWNSSAPQVATVTSAGVVNAVAPGSATITATSEGKSGTAAITVVERSVNSVAVSPSSSSVQQGSTVQLTSTLTDIVGNVLTGRVVSWSSSNSSIASVSALGLVNGVAPGDVIITATSEGRSGSATVKVTAVPVASVVVSPPTVTVMTGGTTTLQATARSSSGATLDGRTVVWSSGDAAIATVSASGVVTGVAAGTAVISATVEGVTGTSTVTVAQPTIASVTVTPASPSLDLGATLQLTATARDAGGNEIQGHAVSWSSSDDSRVFVTSTGVVIALKRGSATVTATIAGVSGSTVVTVK
jgi:trimeric autotransporter adhesin